MKVLLLVLLACSFYLTLGHMRWRCPAPRSDSTGIKNPYPCGAQTGNWTGPVTRIAPGLLTIYFEESISHKGAPFRIALSIVDDSNYDQHLLVDHIPHNDAGPDPIYDNPSTYKQYKLTVNIPNINCPRCSLSIVNPMTDKIPIGDSCTYPLGPNMCRSVYHSCANVIITGTISPPNWDYEYNPPPNWGQFPPPFSPYTQEVGVWVDGWLQGQSNVPQGVCSQEIVITSDLPTNSGLSAVTIFVIVVLAVAFVAIVGFVVLAFKGKYAVF